LFARTIEKILDLVVTFLLSSISFHTHNHVLLYHYRGVKCYVAIP
jgi:hypothetical protein